MSFFRRNKNTPLIPPVANEQPKADPYASGGAGAGGGAAGGRYGGGDPYAMAKGGANAPANANPYAKNAQNPDDAARNELFAGYQAPQQVQATRKYGYEGREQEEDFDEDEEIEGIKQDMRGVKQESLASTRYVFARWAAVRCG